MFFKFKLNDLTSRYSAAQSLIENGQMTERTLSSKLFALEKSLSRLSGVSFAELDETAYQTFDEMTLQYQLTKQKLGKIFNKILDIRHFINIEYICCFIILIR